MRRKSDAASSQSQVGRGRSLITMRANQNQRKLPGPAVGRGKPEELPRSLSSPASKINPNLDSNQNKDYITRSFSTPEPKRRTHYETEMRRNSDTFYRPKHYGSRTELDTDLENFEQFEEPFLDMDSDHDQTIFCSYKRSPDREDAPKKVITTLLPGSGLQRVHVAPVTAAYAIQSNWPSRNDQFRDRYDQTKSKNHFRPLVVKMPARSIVPLSSNQGPPSPGTKELQNSPQLELETAELERELNIAEQHMKDEVAMATEESDADTVSSSLLLIFLLSYCRLIHTTENYVPYQINE